MSSIRRIAPRTCPRCGANETLYLSPERKLTCRLCSYREGEPEAPETVEHIEPPKREIKGSYKITHRDRVVPWAQAAFTTGQDCIRQENWDGALDAFKRALEYQPNFTDGHLWIALLSDDEAVKRDHLTTILAEDPTHPEALRELMVVDGRITHEEAERLDDYSEIIAQSAENPVAAQTTTLHCPVCKGDLTTNADTGAIQCEYCGYQEDSQKKLVGEESLTMALLERRARPDVWKVAEHFLHCNNCGSERTIPAGKLANRCPFCGSNHVIERDALDSFRRPQGVLPFTVTRQEAIAAVRQQLDSSLERVKGWFTNKKVKQATLTGIYLPFWVFDTVTQVRRTRIDRRTDQGRVAQSQPYQTSTLTDMVNNIAICAVTSPSTALTSKLGSYDLDKMRPYKAEMLAKFPAELYTIDFDRASLEARSQIAETMRRKHGRSASSDITINVYSNVTQMTFQLMLMPVWVVTLQEEDGDIRTGLVNGQSGKVVLGKARKSAG